MFERPIAAGLHALSIDYSGHIYLGAQGLFVSEYDTLEGRRRLLLTQFEPGDARRFIPCWDEPARKATFTVAVAAPKDKLAVSNMPIEVAAPLDDDRVYVRFQKTPKMSSYLLFLCVGDLERVSRVSGATVVSVVAKKGSAKDGAFALESADKLLGFYNEYFGVPFPLPKLDMIAAPGAGGFSAMENWGAILYFEDQLLLNPEWSTELKSSAGLCRHCPRDGASMVRQLGDHGVVGQFVAQRRFRFLDGEQGDGPFLRRLDELASIGI